ncbi:MAG: hypothetical protein EXX96DRAFT_505036 [Benjaminiella poitrasii]|nr:MAG: hypothetical protein EXX96DRAFT_505036 [Benjaminiella poitrasii]
MRSEDEYTFLFVENIFQAVYDFYTIYKDIHDGEIKFNGLLLFPFLKTEAAAAAAAVVAEFGAVKTDFCYGKACLEAMFTQLTALNMIVDGSNMYNADGLIRMHSENIHLFVTKASSYFGCSNQSKLKFGCHEGLFRSLTIIKAIADEYQYASITLFKQVKKIIFVHASNIKVYPWSLSFVPDKSMYELWLEDVLDIKPTINDKLEAIGIFTSST